MCGVWYDVRVCSLSLPLPLPLLVVMLMLVVMLVMLMVMLVMVQSIGDGAESTSELYDKVRRKEFKKRKVS